ARYDEIIVVPTDVPQLAARDVRRAFALLRSHELVLGPCDDGGVYLIAARSAERLKDVRWLTPHVLDDLRRGDAALLDPLVDVDDFYVNADSATDDGKYGLHIQARARDSKFRPYFDSNVWLQEAYAFAKTPAGELHVGKIYRRVGLFWDGSFFGNVQYFNGLKLNPDYGAELSGRWYSVQYITNNAHVAGSLDGRDVESDHDSRL